MHTIDDEWRLRNWCLQTQFLPQDHDGENLAEAFKVALEMWELSESNQVCLTTDSGSNMINVA